MDLAHRMRMLMGQDLDEFEIARQIENENDRLNCNEPELLHQAWSVLQSHERSAWKEWITWRAKHARQ